MIKTTFACLVGMAALCAAPVQANTFPTARATQPVAAPPSAVDLNKDFWKGKKTQSRPYISFDESVRGQRIHSGNAWQLGYGLGGSLAGNQPDDKRISGFVVRTVQSALDKGLAAGKSADAQLRITSKAMKPSAASKGTIAGHAYQNGSKKPATSSSWMQAFEPDSCLERKLVSSTLIEVPCQ